MENVGPSIKAFCEYYDLSYWTLRGAFVNVLQRCLELPPQIAECDVGASLNRFKFDLVTYASSVSERCVFSPVIISKYGPSDFQGRRVHVYLDALRLKVRLQASPATFTAVTRLLIAPERNLNVWHERRIDSHIPSLYRSSDA